jgi:ATP-binding cassette, subfamily B, multidrug efflux pump
MAQADARAQMTGRVVDSYTNIQTVKLFAHTSARAGLRPRRDGRVHGDRPPADAAVTADVAMSQWIMWEVAALFENIGTVQDGINTIAQPRRSRTGRARRLVVTAARSASSTCRFHYGRESGSSRICR